MSQPGLILILHPPVPGRQLDLYLPRQLLEGILDSDGHARGDRAPRPTEDLGEGHVRLARVEVPGGHLQARLRHVVTAYGLEGRKHVAWVLEDRAEEPRSQELGDDVPRGFGRLGTVVRVGIGHAFAVADEPAAFHPHENEGPAVGPPETRFKEMDERQAEQSQLDAVDLHSRLRHAPAAAGISKRQDSAGAAPP